MTEQTKQEVISYSEVTLDSVMEFFFKGYRPKEGEILKHDGWFIDTAKGKVIFKIITERSPGGA